MKTLLATMVTLLAMATAHADGDELYEITVTNLTRGQTFTPILAATHKSRIAFFDAGAEASPELALLAEDGDTSALSAALKSMPNVVNDISGNPGMLLGPGESVSFRITSQPDKFRRLSMAAMLIPTNDTFMAVDGVALPSFKKTVFANAYDAGSEPNDEVCANIPGPVCMGTGASPEAGGEGSIHISSGIHGIGDLGPETYDWRNPVAEVEIRRIH